MSAVVQRLPEGERHAEAGALEQARPFEHRVRPFEHQARPFEHIDWPRALRSIFLSRALDELEEQELVPARKVLYQFSVRGHEVTQALLAQMLTGRRDAVATYYRSRPLVLALGLPVADALASTMMRTGGVSEGRDIGVVFNLPRRDGACVLPACGGVGTQYTPAVGWAQSIVYRLRVLRDESCAGSIAVAHGGDASTSANGFWSALNIATTQHLPVLFFIEDNGYGISVKSELQTPGGNVAANLATFRNLRILDGDGSDPLGAARMMMDAVATVRGGGGRPGSAAAPARADRAASAERGGVVGDRAARAPRSAGGARER